MVDKFNMQAYSKLKWCYWLFYVVAFSCAALYLSGYGAKSWLLGYWFVIFDVVLLVLWLNIRLHRSAKAAGIEANTLGLKATLLSCLFFTPIEAVLVLPALNLYRLRRYRTSELR
ncbi:hypothetical protein Sden_1103 [Shewanella denitrificans OS217]|uniref:Uncharacterized protein n=2 Tax=Shewanella TaxID=22 RepID=Q12Q85_SHEDO|nr:hypothetical protein Sden_1103 [Shewanella denitrificans OS217]